MRAPASHKLAALAALPAVPATHSSAFQRRACPFKFKNGQILRPAPSWRLY